MNLIFMGPPGVGKGTQAKEISKYYNIPHVSTGDIFRNLGSNNSPVGLKAKEYMDKGMLVPDDVTNEIVFQRLTEADCKKGFILDGYPRNVEQAIELTKYLKSKNIQIDYVLNISCEDIIITNRITGRRTCPKCGAIFHVSNLEKEVCPYDGEALIQRIDDTIEVVQTRLDIYHSKTKPVISYYSDVSVVLNLNGNAPINIVTNDITNILGKK